MVDCCLIMDCPARLFSYIKDVILQTGSGSAGLKKKKTCSVTSCHKNATNLLTKSFILNHIAV